MPPTLRVIPVSTLTEFTREVEAALTTNGGDGWYRGAGQTTHQLVPGFYRNPPTVQPVEQRALEQRMITWFRQRSLPFNARPLGNDFESLFVMQHFGVPTRLLDWSENPFIALYFALTYAPAADPSAVGAPPAAVWILNPVSWNQAALSGVGYTSGVLTTDERVLKQRYAPGEDISGVDAVAMYGAHNSVRIVAQRGVFTIAGAAGEPMEMTYVRADRVYPQDCLLKLEIPSAAVPGLLRSIRQIGFTDSTVFPDLEGLGRESRRVFNF